MVREERCVVKMEERPQGTDPSEKGMAVQQDRAYQHSLFLRILKYILRRIKPRLETKNTSISFIRERSRES